MFLESARMRTVSASERRSSSEKSRHRATLAAEKDTHAITTGLFIQSLNEMIDLHAKRITVGIRNRIPFSIWLVLLAVSLGVFRKAKPWEEAE